MKRWIHASTDETTGQKAAREIQEFINGYGFNNFDVYERSDQWVAIDVEGDDEDEVTQLINRLNSWGLDTYLEDHYVEIYVGDKYN